MRMELSEGAPDSVLSWRELFETVASEYQQYKQSNEQLKHDIENRLASIQTATEMMTMPDLSMKERVALQKLMQRAITELKALVENVHAAPLDRLNAACQHLSDLSVN